MRDDTQHRAAHGYSGVLCAVAGESAALLQLTLLPIAFLIARGMGMLPQRMALVLRSILLVLLLSQYLYALGVFELFRRVG